MAKPPKFQWAGLGGVSAGGLQNHLLVTPQKVLLLLLQFFWPYSRQTKFLPLCEGTAFSGAPETPGSLQHKVEMETRENRPQGAGVRFHSRRTMWEHFAPAHLRPVWEPDAEPAVDTQLRSSVSRPET